MRLSYPVEQFMRITNGATSLGGEDGKHLVCTSPDGGRGLFLWPSHIERLEYSTEEHHGNSLVNIRVVLTPAGKAQFGSKPTASAEIALPELTAEQLAASRNETIRQTSPSGFEVEGFRPTPPVPVDWRPF